MRRKTVKVYNGRVEALGVIIDYLKDQKEKYAVLADANIALNFDFNVFTEAHEASKADVTMAYKEEPLPAGLLGSPVNSSALYYTLSLGWRQGFKIYINCKETGNQNFY